MRPRSSPLSPRLLILATLTLLAPAAAGAGPGVWTTTGPNAAVSTVVVDPSNPNVVYAGSFDHTRGLFRSGNRGQTWALDLSGVNVQALAISGSPTVVYVGTENGIVKSENGGLTWSAANSGLTSLDITALAAGVSNSDIVYAGTRLGIFRSLNRGASWTALGFGTEPVWSLAVDPTDGLRVYAGISGNLLRSSDGGDTWIVTNAAPTPFSPTEANRFLSIVIAPSDPSSLYASACFCVGGGSYVFRSRDRGVTWAQTFYDPTGHGFLDLAVSRSNPSIVYAAAQVTIYRSLDAGLNWGRFDTGLPNTTILSVETDASSRRVYAGAASSLPGATGVFSFDLGAAPGACAPGPQQICLLGGRFRATLSATDPRTGASGTGQSIPQGDRHGSFSLPTFTGDPSFPEVIVKMLDATRAAPPIGGYFWVFHTGLTDLQYTLTIEDTSNGALRTYRNDRSDPARLCGGADTAAFPP